MITDDEDNHSFSWEYQCSDINERRVNGQKISGNIYFNKPEKIEIRKVKLSEIMNLLCFDGVLSWSLPNSHGLINSITDHNRRSYNPDYELFVSITKTCFHNNSKASFILKDEYVKSFDYKNSNPLRDIFFKCIGNTSLVDLPEDIQYNHIQISDLDKFWSSSSSFIKHLIIMNTRNEYKKLYEYYKQLLEYRSIVDYLKHAIYNIIKSFNNELTNFKLSDSKIPESIKMKSVIKPSSPLKKVNENIQKFYFGNDLNKKSSDLSKKRQIFDSQKSKEESIQFNEDESVIYDDVDFSSLLEDVSRSDTNIDNPIIMANQSSSTGNVDLTAMGYRQIIVERIHETSLAINQLENNRNIPLFVNNSNYIANYQSELSYGQLNSINDIPNQLSSIYWYSYHNTFTNNSSLQPITNVTSNSSSNSHCNSVTIDDCEDDDTDPCYKKFRNDIDYTVFHDFTEDDVETESIVNPFEVDESISSDFIDSPDITAFDIRNSTVPSNNISNNVSRFNILEIDSNEDIIDSNSNPVTDNPVIIPNPDTVDSIANTTDNLDSSDISDLDIFDHNL